MNSYDAWKDGRYDRTSPINQIEVDAEIVTGYDTLSQAYYSGHEEAFQDKQIEILHELNVILEVSKAINSGMVSRIERLINKCK
jgi:hypothetical protein